MKNSLDICGKVCYNDEVEYSVLWRVRRGTVRAEQENRVKSTDGTAAVSVLANPAAAE